MVAPDRSTVRTRARTPTRKLAFSSEARARVPLPNRSVHRRKLRRGALAASAHIALLLASHNCVAHTYCVIMTHAIMLKVAWPHPCVCCDSMAGAATATCSGLATSLRLIRLRVKRRGQQPSTRWGRVEASQARPNLPHPPILSPYHLPTISLPSPYHLPTIFLPSLYHLPGMTPRASCGSLGFEAFSPSPSRDVGGMAYDWFPSC